MSSNSRRHSRASSLKWVAISQMKVSDRAQREFRQAHADEFAADFDLEALGFPVVNQRDGAYFIVDGQHRIAALKQIGWGDQLIQCECYEGLTEAEEAELFLRRDARKAISVFDKFRIGLVANREVEQDIEAIVHDNDLVISRTRVPGGVSAVGTLRRVHSRSGGPTLSRTLRIIRDAYGDPGLQNSVIDGIGHLCHRYNGQLDDAVAIAKLSTAHGGVNGLLGKAMILHKSTGNAKAQCVAAAAVEIINSKRGGKKLPSWWSS
jgi:hypothetical protein